MSDRLAEARNEIAALYDFFVGWFSGNLTESDAVFAEGAADRLHPEFRTVHLSGAEHDRAGILGAMRRTYGTNPGFQIGISDVCLLGEWPAAGLILAGYVETQSGARNTTPPENRRRSTVLFERGGGRLLWRHAQVTALDAE